MPGIAVLLPNWIGDVVMATPAVRALRNHFPSRKLVAVCKPYVADTLAGAPWFDAEVLFDPRGPQSQRFWPVVNRLRQHQLDTAVLFPNSFRSALLARFAGCHHVVGFARYFRDLLLSKRLYPKRDESGRLRPTPIVDDYNRIVQSLGVPDPGHRLELFTTPRDEQAAARIWEKFRLSRFARVIGLNPGGAFGAAKHWPSEHFADLARRLTRDPAQGVLVLCGPSERAIAREIARQANCVSLHTLADEPLSLGLTKAVIRRLRLLVSTDSGPRHFAAAFNIPVVTLFGPTHIAWTETYFPLAIHLQQVLPCGPCQQRVCPLGHHRCMKELAPARVEEAVTTLLAHSPEHRFPSEQTHALEHRHAC
jgi:heptosyltransferase-2